MPLGVASLATSTGGSASGHGGEQVQTVLPDNAHFSLQIPGHDTFMFKVEKNEVGKMIMTSVNAVELPVDVLDRLQKYLNGPQQWFIDAEESLVIDMSKIPAMVTHAEMQRPTGGINYDALWQFTNWIATGLMDDHPCKLKDGIPMWSDAGQCQNKLMFCDTFGTPGVSDNPLAIGDWNSDRPRQYKTIGGNRTDNAPAEKIPDPTRPGHKMTNPAYCQISDYENDGENRKGISVHCWVETGISAGQKWSYLGRSQSAPRNKKRREMIQEVDFSVETRNNCVSAQDIDTRWSMPGGSPCKGGSWFSTDVVAYNNIDWNNKACCTLLEKVGPNVATFKLLVMHCYQKTWTADSGVDLQRAGKLLKIWMQNVLGGTWQTTIQKWGHVHGTAVEVYAGMIEDTLVAAWCYTPAVVTVLSDNTCKTFDVGRGD